MHELKPQSDKSHLGFRVCSSILSFLLVFLLSASYRTHANDGLTAVISTSTAEGRMAVFDDVWSTINERYYDQRFKGLSNGLTWEDQRAIFRTLAAEANFGTELYTLLRRMLSALNDPH